MKKAWLLILFLGLPAVLQAQEKASANAQPDTRALIISDTIPRVLVPVKELVPDSIQEALYMVRNLLESDSTGLFFEPLFREAVQQLIHYFDSPVPDSLAHFLDRYKFAKLYTYPMIQEDTVDIFRTDTLYLPKDSLRQKESGDTMATAYMTDSLLSELPPVLPGIRDSLIRQAMDTLRLVFSDSTSLHIIAGKDTTTEALELRNLRERVLTRDTLMMVDSSRYTLVDSLRQAIQLLVKEMQSDSINLWIRNITNDSLQVWLSDRERNFFRFWVKNEARDSVGLWLEGLDSKNMRMIMDEGVYVRSFSRKQQKWDQVELQRRVDETLRNMNKVQVTTPAWTYEAITGLQFSQGYLSYWAKGGESSVAALFQIEAFANYSKGKSKWENSLHIKTGVLQSGEKGLRKNEDLFEINSSYGEKMVNDWYLSIMGNLKSQFFKGYDYKDTTVVSNFLAPGYLVFALGMDYKPNKYFSLLISPITSKTTIVRDLENVNPAKYGLEEGERIRREMGGYIKTRYKTTLTEDISLENKLDLFTNYSHKPQNIDINWEAVLRMKINLYMDANISTHLIYDDDVDIPVEKVVNGETIKTTTKKIQFKELLSVGFRYRF